MTDLMLNKETVRPAEILLIENNPEDVRLFRVALREGKVHNNLRVVTDGIEALAFLRCEGAYADAVRPDLILLNWNLSAMDGRELLGAIEKDLDLGDIPVVVLTTNPTEQDIPRSSTLQPYKYIIKPVDLEQFIAVVQSIDDFCFTIVTLPRRPQQDGSDLHRSCSACC